MSQIFRIRFACPALWYFVVCLVACLPGGLRAQQEENHENQQENEHVHRRHRLTIGLGHAHIPAGFRNGEKKWLNLGAYALDYDYMITKKWSAGIHSDMVPTTYEVELNNSREDLLERKSPVAAVLLGAYKATEHLGFQLGYGWEITRDESLPLIRIGAEYGWEISGDWELGIGVTYDRKIEEYDTWFLGIMVSRWLGKAIIE